MIDVGFIIIMVLVALPLIVMVYRVKTCVFYANPDSPAWFTVLIISLTVIEVILMFTN